MLTSTEGVILHSLNYSDSSKIITMYSKDFGKIKFLVKGARSNKNKFGSSLEPLTFSRAHFYKKNDRTLHLVSKCELIKPATSLMKNFEQLSFAFAVIEIVKLVFEDEEKNEEIYKLVSDALNCISKSKDNFIVIYFLFLIKLLKFSGFELNLENCKFCNKRNSEVVEEIFVNITNGNVFCKICHNKTKHGEVKISTKTKIGLFEINNSDFSKISEINLSTETKNEIYSFLNRFGMFHLHGLKSLRSLKFLEMYNQN